MVSAKTARRVWHPETEAERNLVREHLKAVLRDPHFANSKRYPGLLRYVVECTLQGNAAQIKERIIGIEVFQRPNDYDTNSDTVVRFTAGEVRKRLSLYNHEHDEAIVEISIPQGSYVPEFMLRVDEAETVPDVPVVAPAAIGPPAAPPLHEEPPAAAMRPARSRSLRWVILGFAFLFAGVLMLALLRAHRHETALDRFWKPIATHEGTSLIVPGGVVFSPNLYSGVETAGKSDEYPFVSMQIAAAIAHVCTLVQQKKGGYVIQPANTTNLSDLRDRPVVLLGGYNNQWALRLLEDTRFHFGSPDHPSILDGEHPDRIWQRDHSQPYAAADDYALIARLHDPTSGSPIIVIAGLGRNGTEAGAQYLTNPRYLAELERQIAKPLEDENIEIVLKVRVVDGRTGAPSLEAVARWK